MKTIKGKLLTISLTLSGLLSVIGIGFAIFIINSSSAADSSGLLEQLPMVGYLFLVAASINLLLTLFVLYRLTFKIAPSLSKISEHAQSVSEGDLSFRMDERVLNRDDESGELLRSFSKLRKSLATIIEQIKKNTERLSSSSNVISDSSKSIQHGMEQMSKAIEHIAESSTSQVENVENGQNSIDVLGKIIDEDLGIITALLASFQEINNSVQDGDKSLDALLMKSTESAQSTKSVYEIVRETNEKAEQISQATTLIASIAEQTNLLALNAAIEAARAGEHGKGFAVVSEEIRNLAEQSASSTAQIDDIVKSLQEKSNTAYNETKMVRDAVKAQMELLTDTKKKFDDINSSINMSQAYVDGIKLNSNQLMQYKDEVFQQIAAILSLAQSNAASTEEVAAGSENQASQTEQISNEIQTVHSLVQELSGVVSNFKI